MKSLSFRSHSLNGRRGWQGRASSRAAARTRNRLCGSGIAVPGELWAGLGGSGRAQPGRATIGPPFCPTRPAAVPALDSLTCPPHCGAPGWHDARSARASLCSGALRPPLAVSGFVALPIPRWAALASALFRPPRHPSLHFIPGRSPGVRVQLQPERSILLGWC